MRSTFFECFTRFCLLAVVGVAPAAAIAALEDKPAGLMYQATSTAKNFRLVLEEDALVVRADGLAVFRHPAAAVSELIIRGNDLDNTLVVDFAGGNPVPPGALTFDGLNRGTDFDTLELASAQIERLVNDARNAHDGSLGLQLVGGRHVNIHYLNIEPINAGTAADTVINLPAGPDTYQLIESGANQLTIEPIGTPTFETTIISQPTNSLTINGGSDDAFSVNGPLVLNFDLVASSGSVAINADLDAEAVSITGDLTVGAALEFGIGGTTPGPADNQHEQYVVVGGVDLGAGSLSVVQRGGFVPIAGDGFTLIDNDGADPISGVFIGLPEGAQLPESIGGMPVTISYVGGDGNDVVLTAQALPPVEPPVEPPTEPAPAVPVPAIAPWAGLGLALLIGFGALGRLPRRRV